jgi:hypothetical protein
MTAHLAPDELIDALDGVLAPERDAHLRGCDECLAQLAGARSAIDIVREPDDAPSSFLLNRLTDRIQAATVPAGARRWPWWQPAGVLAGLAAALVVGLSLRAPATRETPAPVGQAANAAMSDHAQPLDEEASVSNNAAWVLVSDMTAHLSTDDVQRVLAPSADRALLDSLNADERRAFVRLVRAEMGGLE